MEYKTIRKLLDSMTNQTPKHRTRTWIEMNDNAKTGIYDAADQVQSKSTMLRLSLCFYSDAYKPVNITITITRDGVYDTEIRNKM